MSFSGGKVLTSHAIKIKLTPSGIHSSIINLGSSHAISYIHLSQD